MINNNTHNEHPLPDEWYWTTVGELSENIQYGHTESAKDEPVGPKFLRITDIQHGRVNWETVPYCKCSEEEHNKYRLRPGDIVFARTGATTGKSYLIANCPDAVFASYLIRLRPSELLDGKYFALFLTSPFYWDQIMVVKKGSAQPGVNATILATLNVPLAPIPEQHRIVAEIETQFTRLDAAVAALERAQANLQRYKASVLKAACEGRLLAPEELKAIRESPDYEPADVLLQRILAERRQRWEGEQWQKEIVRAKKKAAQAKRKAAGLPARISDLTDDEWKDLPEVEYADYLPKNDKWKDKYKESSPPDTQDFPNLPKGWCWTKFGQLISSFRSGSSAVPEDEPTNFPILRSSSVRPLKVDYQDSRFVSDKNSQKADNFLQRDDLLFTRLSGSLNYVGNCALVKGSGFRGIQYPDRLFRAQLVKRNIGRYVEICFASPQIRKEIMTQAKSTAGHQRISMGEITEQILPLPALTEQHRIVEEVERRLSVVAALEAAIEANLRRAKRLRQSILKRAFEGRLVSQDPNDEPASVLLERIQAEKAQREVTRKNKKTNRKKQQSRQLKLV
ncbi:MAG: hypothetical protein GY832_35655 [Chloroflexi bacterium]|nr:hypothetical protein [Chloroflexota bacterium]